MRIPSSFILHGEKITVEQDDALIHRNDSTGEARYRDSKIVLQATSKAHKATKARTEQIFLHELVHFILHHMGENDLCNNEKFVDLFARLLHQFNTTQDK